MTQKRVAFNELESFIRKTFSNFRWELQITFQNRTFSVGKREPHWSNEPLIIKIKSDSAAKAILDHDALGVLIKTVDGEIDLSGNIYVITFLKDHGKFKKIKSWRWLKRIIVDNLPQTKELSKINVKSHYDMPEQAIGQYLDSEYESYSSAMWEDPFNFNKEELTKIGNGKSDNFDSLEKAQWRKFKDGMDFIMPKPGEKIIDIGCGYGGQLKVGLEECPGIKYVGWTHSHNQAQKGKKLLANFPQEQWELNEGDYREEKRYWSYDHVTSSGMVSHVGPRGLIPYLKNVRRLMKPAGGGKYVHHAIMASSTETPVNWSPGTVFNKMYVWPGFHWFTPSEHHKALEDNGFRVYKIVSLNDNYSKTTAAWYLRFKKNEKEIKKYMNEKEFRAWEIYLAGAVGAFKRTHHTGGKFRFYCYSLPVNPKDY